MSDIYVNGVTYRQQFRKCGKAGCKCNTGDEADMHGPYWYAYGLSFAAKYVGKELPKEILEHLDLLEAEKDQIKKIRGQVKERMDEHYRIYSQADRERRAIDALLRGDYVDAKILKNLGLERFAVNGSK